MITFFFKKKTELKTINPPMVYTLYLLVLITNQLIFLNNSRVRTKISNYQHDHPAINNKIHLNHHGKRSCLPQPNRIAFPPNQKTSSVWK